MRQIPYARHSIDASDIEAVTRVLQSDFLTQGPEVRRFEEAVAQYAEAPHAVAVSSGTAALHLACLAMDLGPGDCLWTSPVTFVASANCARYCGAEVDFVDIDPRTYNLSPIALRVKLESAKKENRLPKIVVVVHLAGQPCDLEAIRSLSLEYGFRIIEDASHAIGARYQGKPVGCCEFSDAAVFSFHPVKIITTGEGGMVLTRNEKLRDRLERLRSHGITRNAADLEYASPGSWYYEQLELGIHGRMTDIQAALGTSQLRRIETFLSRRREIAARYDELLSDLPLVRPFQDPRGRSSWHLYIIRTEAARHREIFEGLRASGVSVNLHYIPVYLQPDFQRLGFRPGYCPEAESYYAEAISLPMYYELGDDAQSEVVKLLTHVLDQA